MDLCWEHSPPRRSSDSLFKVRMIEMPGTPAQAQHMCTVQPCRLQGIALGTTSIHSQHRRGEHAADAPQMPLPQWGPSPARLTAHPLSLAKQAAVHHSADFQESSSIRAALQELASSGSGSDMTAFCPSALRLPRVMPFRQQDDPALAPQPSILRHQMGSVSCPSLEGIGPAWPSAAHVQGCSSIPSSAEPSLEAPCSIEDCQALYKAQPESILICRQ